MSDDIKKLLSIMNETTTSGAVAPVAGGMGKSMLKRPADSIFAAESVPENADTGLEAAPKVDSPANFGLWKNSVLTGKKKNKLREATEREQGVIDTTRRGRQSRERNAGLNEPDELPSADVDFDFGTWHFTADGVPMKKDGEVYYSSNKKHNDEVMAHLKKKAAGSGKTDVVFAVVPGVVQSGEQLNELSPKTLASYKKKAGQSASEADKRGDFAKGHKRFKGINKATRKEFDNDLKGVAEATGDVKFDKMLKGITGKKEVAKQQKTDAKQQARDAFDGMFGGGNPADKLSIRKKGVAEGKEDKIAQLKKDYDTAVHWSKNEKSPQKRETARQTAEKIKRHLDTQYKTKLDEYSEWDGTGDQDTAAAIASSGYEAGFADIEDKTSLSEAEITEEMIADRLKNELALFKKGTKSKDKSIGKKPADREVQKKEKKAELSESAQPKLPGAPSGIEIMTPEQFLAASGALPGEQEVEEATELPAQQRELGGDEFQDYMTRIKGTDDIDKKTGEVKVDKKGIPKYTTGKTKTDKFKMPYIHRSSAIEYYDPEGKRFSEEKVIEALKQRPKSLLKQNEKMKHSNGAYEQFFNVGFAALTGIAVDEKTNKLIVVNTCPGAGSCKVDCFAMKGGKVQFKAAWLSDGRILTYLLNDPTGFFNQLSAEITKEEKAGKKGDKKFPGGWETTVRWHDAGDFFSPEYLDMALKMAAKHPDVKFYAYTKMAGAALAKKPPNFIINWSEGAHTSQEKQVKQADPNLERTKNSRIVPEKLFYDLLAKDDKGNLAKGAAGQWQVASPEALKELKQRLAQAYNLSPNSILSYDEYMTKGKGSPVKWNVIVAPGEGDVSANDQNVLSTLLLRH